MTAAATDKAFETVRARCALIGAALVQSTDDRDQPAYVLTKGAATLHFGSLHEVESWLRLAEWVRQRAGAAEPPPADVKTLATLKAALALRGHAVHQQADGGFLVCKLTMSKHCPDLQALAAFAKLVGATA